MMRVFQTSGPARYAFRAVFGKERYANVSFFDQSRENILFHISLRADEGVLSLNHRDATGWGRERHCRVPVDDSGTDVELVFENGQVRIRVAGAPVAWRHWRRWRFDSLDQIALVEYHGAPRASGFDLDTRRPGDALNTALSLSRQFELRGCLPEGTSAPSLQVSGTAGALPVPLSAPQDGMQRYTVVLPGRIWSGAGDAVDLTLVDTDGARIADMRLSRDDLLARIREVLSVGTLAGDSYLTAVMAEHLKFSGLLAALEGGDLAVLAQAAHLHNLSGYLGDLPAAHPDFSEPSEQEESAQVHHAIADVTAALSEPDADIRAVLADISLPVPEARRLFIALLEPFCVSGGVRTLLDWAETAALGSFDPGPDDWRNSAILPHLLLKGRLSEVLEVLDSLVRPRGSWVVTPAIAWVACEALEQTQLPVWFRNKALMTFARFLTKHAGEYWDRMSCAALVDAAVRVIDGRDRVPGKVAGQLTRAVLRTYGLSRDFWHKIDAAGIDLPDELATARDAFASVETALRDSGGTNAQSAHEALTWFSRMSCADTIRVRRDLFGPAGIPVQPGALPEPRGFMLAAPDPREAAFRAAAFPGAPALSGDLADFCARSMPRFYDMVPIEPKADVQLRAVQTAVALAGGADPSAGLTALNRDLIALTVPETRFSGIAIALGLMAAVEGGDLSDPVFSMVQKLVLSVRDEQLPEMGRSPAVIAALQTLKIGDALADRARRLFPDFTPLAPGEPDPLPASPVFNTIVTVFSCRAHLDTRIPAMRDGWLRDLKALGIPYVVVVGDGDGTLNGDVLALDAPDDYEGLPQKTLATIRWIHDRTGYTHLVKVDDDCFLNVPAFFGSYSYRKADYYGRPLTRGIGQTDRAWHIAKATTERGRTELDKSPEPSTYADGGSGYALSRDGMAAALRAARSPAGQVLQQVSFMEDKLLGDLLSLEAIAVENTGYHMAIRRRMAPDGRPVSRWVNSFDASRAAPVKLVHMDTHEDQAGAMLRREEPLLLPGKIWPSYQNVRLGYQSNTLELVGPVSGLEGAREAAVSVVACVRNEMFMLPHFLRHYRRLGVDNFLIADNCSDDGTLEFLAEQPDVALFSVDTDYSLSRYGVAWQQAMMSAFRVGKWSLVADADELLIWQRVQTESLPQLLSRPAFKTADAARVFMLDLYPHGSLEEADFRSGDLFAETGHVDRDPFLTAWPGRGPYSNARTWTSALRHRLIPGTRPDLFVAQKLALLRYHPWMRFSDGLHYGSGMKVAERELLFGHFKYNADFRRKVQDEVARGQHFNDAEEYRKYLARLSEGREVIFDPGVSVGWTRSPFVRARLDDAD